ncbi:MAG: DinB family protein [Gemmatimonadaceae bacterium]
MFAVRETRRWAAAIAEHQMSVDAFVATCERVPADLWHVRPAPGKWTPASVVLHVCEAYQLGRDAAAGGAGMRLRVTPLRAWGLRTFLFPLLLLSRRFPRGVPAPAEVRPDEVASEQLSLTDGIARLRHAAREASSALRGASDARPLPRMAHAYFGPLRPRAALRLLSAHTSHHARGLARAIHLAADA